eukprot:Plantae.Rhodophyta-Hildenbrandia_rubra.ctg15765.p3 GENE.Plantae.Rhodophyta-Hildenbrandia_rubra.ctg15765~~Plantae.Rhodophyta-Hildenbrandia_rubra.ctg15765.p3  ORF type:complete len:254 (+),score=64.26 Plantae.Rhodophyta-Hildenbrandia_rubra.ctg15765:3058-3819(+)
MSGKDDENLDEILDSALGDFKLPPPPPASEASSAEEGCGNKGDSSTAAEDQRALEEALKSLNALNVDEEGNIGNGESADGGLDMKLLEDFVKVLADQPLDENKGGPSTEGDSGEKAKGAAGFEGMLEKIVGRLLSKEIFRGPMLQMRDAYAGWIPENEGKVDGKDMERYKKQSGLVEDICSEYAGEGNFEKVMVLLESMQACGSPPKEIMEKLSAEGVDPDFLGASAGGAGLDSNSEQLPPELEKLNDQCKVQ